MSHKTSLSIMISDNRQKILESALGAADSNAVMAQLGKSNATGASSISGLDQQSGLSQSVISRAKLADAVAHVTGDNVRIASAILADSEVKTLRDLALKYTPDRVARIDLTGVSTGESQGGSTGKGRMLVERPVTPEAVSSSAKAASVFQHRLFHLEPSAVLQRMVANNEVQIHRSSEVRAGVVKFLDSQPSFNIRNQSILVPLSTPGILDSAFGADQSIQMREDIIQSLKTLQRVQALTPTPDAISPLLDNGFSSAFQVSSVPERKFISTLTPTLLSTAGVDNESDAEALARQIHAHAMDNRIRIDSALLQIYQTIKGTGLALIDGYDNVDTRMQILRRKFADAAGQAQINLEELFGDMDFCDCDDCSSVTSPTAYYVELLQYLRNNDLDPSDKTKFPNTGKPGYAGTALEKLFFRRPDLQHLELTCANANTVLPYIDLANEVMESFIVHLKDYTTNWSTMKQTTIDVFNVEDETTSELLASPQHTNYKAYCILKNARFPIDSLPYFQPLDAIRIYLRYLGTTRYELIDTFRRPEKHPGLALTPSQVESLTLIHTQIQDRAAASEYLGFSLDEYAILTKEIFWPKTYFDLTQPGGPITPDQYQKVCGLRPLNEYWGYSTIDEMLQIGDVVDSPTGVPLEKPGLCWVKAQFLRRSGLSYPETVDLVQTRFVNPCYPTGRDKLILESIRFSYRFLQTLVNPNADSKCEKFKVLVQFLALAQPWVEYWNQATDRERNACNLRTEQEISLSKQEIRKWVHTWFECLGNIVVLESGEGPELPLEGNVIWISQAEKMAPQGDSASRFVSTTATPEQTPSASSLAQASGELIGYLSRDGLIRDREGGSKVIATVAIDGQVFTPEHELLSKTRPSGIFTISTPITDSQSLVNIGHRGSILAFINTQGYLEWFNLDRRDTLVKWLPTVDSCNIDKVRILHLDGTSLSCDEWDRIGRFIRLYRRISWTIDEIDKAIVGLSHVPELPPAAVEGTPPEQPDISDESRVLNLNDFNDVLCGCGETDCSCSQADPEVDPCDPADRPDINPGLLKQLMYVKKLQILTGVDLDKLLVFWGDIGTQGITPLYSKLFLTHNLIGIDNVFQGDGNGNGNFLTGNEKISDHFPVILTALQVKEIELAAILQVAKLDSPTTDKLTISSISAVYRYRLLAKALGVRTPSFYGAIETLGGAFGSAKETADFVTLWNRMTNIGFTLPQLLYVIKGTDDPYKPLAPPKVTVLRTAKTILDGLNSISVTNADLTTIQEAAISADGVGTKASLLFSSSVVSDITGLIEGTKTYTTNAPVGLDLKIPPTLSAKITYTDPKTPPNRKATITVKGNLTEQEEADAKALVPTSDAWAAALDRTRKQAVNLVKSTLSSVFKTNIDAVVTALTAGDVPATPAATEQDVGEPGSAPEKRRFFLKLFLPYLRSQLEEKLIIDTMSSASSLSPDITGTLLKEILHVGSGDSQKMALVALRDIGTSNANAPSAAAWRGYLVPPTTDTYTFWGTGDTQPTALIIDEAAIQFVHQNEDPSNLWSTDPISLIGGQLYLVQVTGQTIPGDLQWKTDRDAISTISSSSLIPDYSINSTMEVFEKVRKAAIIINGFSLDIKEVSYFQRYGESFSKFDFNLISIDSWRRVLSYTELRNSLVPQEKTLIDLFSWAGRSDSKAADIAANVSQVTTWDAIQVQALINADNFDLQALDAFTNEIALLKIQKALDLVTTLGVLDAKIPFSWVNLLAHFNSTKKIADDIRNNIRSRYTLTDYETAVKPLHDELRRNQRNALIAFLVVQPELNKWGVIDADSLFEFFLIDVQMGACLQTSRIKQAISTVQSFVQRCILGLEAKYDIENDALDSKRWEWMSKQTVWTANRKVFLYPENWIVSSLRDDKSPFYKELEGELLQKDINPQNNQNAFKSYLHKLDQVASLRSVGLYIDKMSDTETKLYCFARTESSPYFFFYRTLQRPAQLWTPWEKVQIDIPMYSKEYQKPISGPEPGQVLGTTTETLNGCYVTPIVWNGRLFIFIGHFYKKTIPNPSVENLALKDMQGSSSTTKDMTPLVAWEIKLGWSELRLGKWTQKQLSTDSIITASFTAQDLVEVDSFKFVPQIKTGDKPGISIGVWQNLRQAQGTNTLVGRFLFRGTGLFKVDDDKMTFDSTDTGFHYIGATYHDRPTSTSLQRSGDGATPFFGQPPYIEYPGLAIPDAQIYYGTSSHEDFFHPYAHQLLAAASTSDDFQSILNVFDTVTDDVYIDSLYGRQGDELSADGVDHPKFHELKTPYALYNWEIGFHAPLQLADALLNAQQFDKALEMMHAVFNPYADGADEKRVWKWRPFKLVSSESVLETLFNSLKPNKPDQIGGPINEWRDNPFAPHVVARDRPVAYMKWTVMKYIQILVAYGDYYFRRNTLEDLPSALQCYVLASHVYGPKGQRIPKRGKKKPETYWSLLDKWDAFGNAVVNMELAFPFSNQTPQPIGISNNEIVLANLFGFATTRYFCIPDNPQLRGLRDTIDDRLYKIRHCMDIDGNVVSRPLWDPPIDPMQLVQAVASGLSLSSALNDLNASMPNYRFYFLLQKAFEICADLKGLCSQFLATKEKRDTEALTLLRNTHEMSMNDLVMEMKKKALEESLKAMDTLRTSRESPNYRYQFYASLAGADAVALAEDMVEFQFLNLQIEHPQADGDLRVTSTEKAEMEQASEAQDWNEAAGHLETLSGILLALPSFNIHMTPVGVGTEVAWGMPNIGSATTAASRFLQTLSGKHTYASSSAGKKATNIKQFQERVQQMNIAGFEYGHITSQMKEQQLRIDSANQDIVNQQKTIDNSVEIDQFLRNKYSNDELYDYLEGSLRQVMYQTYTLAYDIARQAELAYHFERSIKSDQKFIQFGYFNQGRDGLQSGEQLYLALKRMEAAYQLERGYDFEVTKSVCLRQLNPYALLELRETGVCKIDLPEILFDMDFPGHYNRRIKSVTLTIPCLVGPYTSVNCTLTLTQHRYRVNPLANDAKDYVEKQDTAMDPRFQTVRVPINTVAISSAQNDAGVFDLQLKDERYIPFEGAGAVSSWTLQLPTGFKQFDYDTITDVILGIRYTSCNGGDKLRACAAGAVATYITSIAELSQRQGLFALFDVKAEFSNEWVKLVAAAAKKPASPIVTTLVFQRLVDRLPIFTKGRAASSIQATDITVLTPMDLKKADFAVNTKYVAPKPGEQEDTSGDRAFESGPVMMGKLKAYSLSGLEDGFDSDWALRVKVSSTLEVGRIWVLVRYQLKQVASA